MPHADPSGMKPEGEDDRVARHPGRHSTWVSLDELIAKGRTLSDRVRPIMERTVDRLRARFARK
jgi:hypothetical protein